MAEKSMFWATGSTGDGLNPYTQAEWIDFIRRMFIPLSADQAIVLGEGSELIVTSGTDSVSVGTGAAIVYGFPYVNSASKVLSITRPVVATTGINIVLRATWSTQTVRLVVIRNTDGVAAVPAVTQTAGTTWEVSLATGTITTLGAVTVTNLYAYARYPSQVVASHQGGSSGTWGVKGTTNYAVGLTQMENGTIEWTGGAAASGTLTVSPYVAAIGGIYFVTPKDKMVNAVMYEDAFIPGIITLDWATIDGSTKTAIEFQWFGMSSL